VIEQYPDWYGGNKQTHPAHTFARDDHLNVTTNTDATFRVDLAGGSTYDSDIVYDGAVDGGDFVHLDGLLNLGTIQNQLQIPFDDPLFDPTADINARCPNEAAGTHATCDWPLFGTPPRELGHGDFGPLNVEWDRARAPFLDLDPDNSSGAKGVDSRTVYTGEQPAPIADSDARFANSVRRVMEQLSFAITDDSKLPEDRLIVDESRLVPLGLKAEGNGTHHLILRSSGPEKIAVEQYTAALQYVRFESSLLTDRTVEIQVQAKGAGLHDLESAADVQLGAQIAFTSLDDDAELWGNVAVARVVLSRPESLDATEFAVVDTAAESESDSPVTSRTSYLAAPAVMAAGDEDPSAESSNEVACESDTRQNPENTHDVNGDSYDKTQEALPATDPVAAEELVAGKAESAQRLAAPTRIERALDGPDIEMVAVWTTQQEAEVRAASALDSDSRDAGDRLELIAPADASVFAPPSVFDEQRIPADRRAVLAGDDSEDLHIAVMEVEDLLSDLVEEIAAVGLR
jgi:hypothetical protein